MKRTEEEGRREETDNQSLEGSRKIRDVPDRSALVAGRPSLDFYAGGGAAGGEHTQHSAPPTDCRNRFGVICLRAMVSDSCSWFPIESFGLQ